MIFGSVCSGIEAASVAWKPLGWTCAWVSEIDPFASAVLAQRYPHVPNLGDFTRIGGAGGPTPRAIDLLVGGTPCQDFSVAGEGEGLDGADGRLALEYMALVGRLRPRWLVWENVPGVLSQNGGRDFGTILGALAERGYGFAYRVLDAQYFGVPQRRRRVFLVGHLGDWRPPAAVLFERHSLQGHPAPRRQAGQSVAATLGTISGSHSGGIDATQFDRLGAYVVGAEDAQEAYAPLSVASTLRGNADSLTGFDGGAVLIAFQAQGGPHSKAVGADIAPTLKVNGSGNVAVVLHENQRGELFLQDTAALNGGGGKPGQGYAAALVSQSVRRLTPRECERLQGLPDDWTLIQWRGKPAPDTPRYRAIGNSIAVPCLRWIGERINLVEEVMREVGRAV